MALYKHIRQNFRRNESSPLQRERILKWRREPVTLRIEKPTRLDRARSLGYRAKQGIIVVRQRVSRGGRQRPQFKAGRRPKHYRTKKILDKNYQQIAEEKASKAFTNCEVLNSYFVGKDGHHYWYEVIMLDRFHPQVKADKQLSQVGKQSGRPFRGLTSAGRKSRGLRHKGKGAEKVR